MRSLFLFLTLLVFGLKVNAQKKTASRNANPPIQKYDSILELKKWRNIGPFRGGRANAISGVSNNPLIYYTGYTGGGVWKTIDGGKHWMNVSDGFFKVGTIGEIAVASSDPNVIYVGTGEHEVRGVMTSFGDGVYKSTDAGKTWKNIGLTNSRHIADIVIHPSNPDVVLVAAQGPVHGTTNERGIYKTIDGGKTWKQVLYVDSATGASSLVADPTNPRILYAATWDHKRLPWKVISGGRGSSLWKSTDGGETWNKINNGLPSSLGKMGVSVSAANPNRIFAIVKNEKVKSGLYRSDNGGESWSLMSNDANITSRSWYYMEVFADPKNENTVYVLNAPMMKSIDGGKTFSFVPIAHGDTHDLWINPNDPNNIALADDGGGQISYDGTRSWSTLMNQPTAQIYRVNADNRFPYWVYGGQQDNTSLMVKTRNNKQGLDEKDWLTGPGCESAYIVFDPNNPVEFYGGCYQGYIEVLNGKTGEIKDIQAYPSLNLAVEPKKMKYRFNWNAPIVASPHDPKTIYHGGNVVLKTTDGGLNWSVISPDLTRNDTTKQEQGGGPLTNEGAGGENYNTIYYLIESTLEKGQIWTGSDCGKIYITRDGGKTWNDKTPAGLEESLIQSIELSPFENGTAYVSATRYKFNDFKSYTYKTTDFGTTWTLINTGVAEDDFIKVIREDKTVKNLLYAGAERGFYISYNGGTNWSKLQLNLPVVPVTDLIIHDNDLVAATAGRAFWILDDLTLIQHAKEITTEKQIKLWGAKPTVLYSGAPELGGANEQALGQNPLEGVTVFYRLPKITDSAKLSLQIQDANGKTVRSYSNKKDLSYKPFPGGPPPAVVMSSTEGLNALTWDFRADMISPAITDAFVYGDYSGYLLKPGKYKAVLKLDSLSTEVGIEVKQDPNISATEADWNEQQALLEDIQQSIKSMHSAVNKLRSVKKQILFISDNLKEKADYKAVVDSGKSIIKLLEAWESNIVESRQKNFQDVINWPSKLNAEFFNLKTLVNVSDPRVTGGAKTRLKDLKQEWAKYEKEMNEVLLTKIKEFQSYYQSKGVPVLVF